jgi:hypothetical protein
MKTILVLLFLFHVFYTTAQDRIETDRPSETQSVKLVDKKTFQVEAGVSKQKQEEDAVWEQPDILLRFGLLKKLELRMRTVWEKQDLVSENMLRKGLLPPELGLKLSLFQTKNFTASFLGMAGISPLAAKDHDPGKWIHRIRLLFENKLTEKLSLAYNLGTEWDSEEQLQRYIYTLSPQFEISEHLKAFVETFGYLKKGYHPQPHLDAGLAYLPGKNVQLDLYGGIGLNAHAPDFFINAGCSFRLP